MLQVYLDHPPTPGPRPEDPHLDKEASVLYRGWDYIRVWFPDAVAHQEWVDVADRDCDACEFEERRPFTGHMHEHTCARNAAAAPISEPFIEPQPVCRGVVKGMVLDNEYCRQLKEEIWHLAPKDQREQVGVQLGARFKAAVDAIIEAARPLWEAVQLPGETLLPYDAVVMRYSRQVNSRIPTHVDDCEATLNICLQAAQAGGAIKFFLPEVLHDASC